MRNSTGLISDPGEAPIRFGPIWGQVFYPAVLAVLAAMVQACVNLVRPDWVMFRNVVRVALESVWLVIFTVLVLAGDWVILADPCADRTGEVRTKLGLVNYYLFFWSLLVTAVVCAVVLVFEIRRLVRRK
jgi:hypothetical protein